MSPASERAHTNPGMTPGRHGTVEITHVGRVAVVTGAGRRMGRAHALELARRGAAVVVNDVLGLGTAEGPAADRVVDEIERAGGTAIASHDSVATAEGGRAIVQEALERFGRIDIVVHNAGAWRNAPFEDMTPENLDPVLDVHLRGAFFVTQPAWRAMKARSYGRIVLVSSTAGAFGRENGANYCAAKAGLLGLCRALALEGAEHGIKTNCVLPLAAEGTEVDIAQRSYPGPWRQRLDAASSELARSRRQPERVSALVAYLSSEACALTGEALSAVSGRYARAFSGLTAGWLDVRPGISTAEDIAAHLDEIRDLASFIVPGSLLDELRAVSASLDAHLRADALGEGDRASRERHIRQPRIEDREVTR